MLVHHTTEQLYACIAKHTHHTLSSDSQGIASAALQPTCDSKKYKQKRAQE